MAILPALSIWLLLGAEPVSNLAPTTGAQPEQPPARFLLEWGKKGSEPGEFNIPIGVAIGPDDNVFVSDLRNDRVQKFAANGKFLASFPVAPHPAGIAVDKSGRIYVCHYGFSFVAPKEGGKEARQRDKVGVYDATGKLLHEWGKTGAGDGEFDLASGIAVASNGRVYVADSVNHRIQVFDAEGKFLAKWGSHGKKPGQFGGDQGLPSRTGGPIGVGLDRAGNVYTTEAGRVQKFTEDGKVVLAWGDNENRPGSFGGGYAPNKKSIPGPIGICVDKQDRVWVTAVSGRVQRFSVEGNYLGGIGEEQGAKPGQFRVPHGVAVDSRGHLYVVDTVNYRIQKFAVAD